MKTYPCNRCDGRGHITAFSNVLGGICFKCGGSGRQTTRPRAPRAPKAPDPAIARRSAEIIAKAVELYQDDPRLRVDKANPYFRHHCLELGEKDGVLSLAAR